MPKIQIQPKQVLSKEQIKHDWDENVLKIDFFVAHLGVLYFSYTKPFANIANCFINDSLTFVIC